MIFSKQIYKVKCYTSVDEIPTTNWEELACVENLYFSPKYLSAIAKNNTTINFFYLIVKNTQKQAVAIAVIQMIDLDANKIQNNIKNIINNLSQLEEKSKLINSEKTVKILICGNIFVSGECGIFIKPNQNKKEIITVIYQNLSTFNCFKNKIDAYILKDFEHYSLKTTDELQNYGFHSFKAEPNMQLQLNENWNSFEDYLTEMKTKFRVKAKKALKESNGLTVKNITLANIDLYLPKIEELYKKVILKSEFNLKTFNVATYKSLIHNLGDDYLLRVYCLDYNVVGFLSGMFHKNSLDAHFVGIDYDLNKQYYIYQRILYDYIENAIIRNVNIINFGRTASAIKSSVGAVPQDLTIYFKHTKIIANQLSKFILKRISPSTFRQSFPFKK